MTCKKKQLPSDPEATLDDDKELEFVSLSKATVGTTQDVVQRIGSAIIGGDFSGNARGESAIDIQIARDSVIQVASGARAIAFGARAQADGADAVALGSGVQALGDYAFALGYGSAAQAARGVAVGTYACEALAEDAIAVGIGASAAGLRSLALGYHAAASLADDAVIAGNNVYQQLSTGAQKRLLNTDDLIVGAYLPLIGGTLTGDLVMNKTGSLGAAFITNSNYDVRIGNSLTAAQFRLLPYSGDIYFDNTEAGGIYFRANTDHAARKVMFLYDNGTEARAQINTTGSNVGFNLAVSDAIKWAVSAYRPVGTNYSFVMYNNQTAANSLFINGDTDNVGIGLTGPNEKLDVSGNCNVSGVYKVSGVQVVTSRQAAAYAGNAQGVAYTGIDNAQAGTVYAKVADLNTLRTAYEALRAGYENLRTALQTHGLIS